MAVCEYCNEDMLTAATCTLTHLEFDNGITLPRSNYHFQEYNGRCHDCNIIHGHIHHAGCDVERCPCCKGQLITCDCGCYVVDHEDRKPDWEV